MSAWQAIKLALRSIQANRVRALLTMLGIIIGVASVIALSAVGQGATLQITKQVQSLGSNLLTVFPGASTVGGISQGQGAGATFTMTDVNNIQSQDSAVEAVAPLVNTRAQVTFQANNYQTSIQGSTANYLQVKPRTIAEGRFYFSQEVTRNASVAVLGATVVQNLFTGTGVNPVGETININGIPFTVIGVFASQGSNGFQNLDDMIMIPITTEMNLFTGPNSISTINIAAKNSNVINLAQSEVTQTLRNDQRLAPGVANNFTVSNQASVLSSFQSIMGVLSALLASVAGISLLVGGIGIMNIMLVSVTERTREIGIRKAIGAKRSTILMQFLIEAVLVSVIGGIIGIVIGGGGAEIVGQAMGIGNVLTVTPILLSFIFSLLIGTIFGVYPARKAAYLQPIEALRYE